MRHAQLIVRGQIHTGEPNRPPCEALAIADGRVVGRGRDG